MSNLIKFAQAEFSRLGWPGDDVMQRAVCEDLLELLRVFSNQGHSGASAPYVLGLFHKLAAFQPIAPLTGAEEEWGEPFDEEGTQQNKRCHDVFRYKDGKAYWSNGRIFQEKSTGCSYTSKESKVEIGFPWTKPEPEIVEVP